MKKSIMLIFEKMEEDNPVIVVHFSWKWNGHKPVFSVFVPLPLLCLFPSFLLKSLASSACPTILILLMRLDTLRNAFSCAPKKQFKI